MKKQNTVGERLKMLRTSLKLNTQQFAAAVDLTQTSVYRLESGVHVPHAKTINNIAKVFGVNPEWINTGEGELTFQHVQNNSITMDSPWKDAAFTALREERDRLIKDVEFFKAMLMDKVTGKSNFLKVVKNTASL